MNRLKLLFALIILCISFSFAIGQTKIYAAKFEKSELQYLTPQKSSAYNISSTGILMANTGYILDIDENGNIWVRPDNNPQMVPEIKFEAPKKENGSSISIACGGNCPDCGMKEESGHGGETIARCGGDCPSNTTCEMFARITPGGRVFIKLSAGDDWRNLPREN